MKPFGHKSLPFLAICVLVGTPGLLGQTPDFGEFSQSASRRQRAVHPEHRCGESRRIPLRHSVGHHIRDQSDCHDGGPIQELHCSPTGLRSVGSINSWVSSFISSREYAAHIGALGAS